MVLSCGIQSDASVDGGDCVDDEGVTADAFEDTRNLCMAAGFDGWLAKPFRIQDLARVMDQVLVNRSPYKSPASQIL